MKAGKTQVHKHTTDYIEVLSFIQTVTSEVSNVFSCSTADGETEGERGVVCLVCSCEVTG